MADQPLATGSFTAPTPPPEFYGQIVSAYRNARLLGERDGERADADGPWPTVEDAVLILGEVIPNRYPTAAALLACVYLHYYHLERRAPVARRFL